MAARLTTLREAIRQPLPLAYHPLYRWAGRGMTSPPPSHAQEVPDA
jgi:hypothetical protein